MGWDGCSYLLAVLQEPRRGVHAVCHGAADEGEPVEDDGGLIGVLEQDLLQDIEDDREDHDAEANAEDLGRSAHLVELLGHGSCHLLEEAHGCRRCCGLRTAERKKVEREAIAQGEKTCCREQKYG